MVVVVVSEIGVAGGGGVIEPELPFLTGELQPFRLVRCCCGDRGVTTRAPSGESGVRHCSLLPTIDKIKKRKYNYLVLFMLSLTFTHRHTHTHTEPRLYDIKFCLLLVIQLSETQEHYCVL